MSKSFILTNQGATATLYPQDCIEGMQRHLEPSSVDVVVTSPPYNLGIKYSHYDDSGSRQDYLEWIEQWAAVVKLVLQDDGSLFLNVGSKPTDPTIPFQVLNSVQKHFQLQNVIHWIKSIAIEKRDAGNYPNLAGDISVGHYKPINSPRFLNDCHEYIFHLTKQGNAKLDRLAIGVPYQDKSNVTRWHKGNSAEAAGGAPARDLRCRGNTWFIPYETIRDRAAQRPHPATFPVKLAEMCIKLHGVAHTRLVLDPFLGIGQSAIAAAHLQVNFVGFEIDRAYYDKACARLRLAGSRGVSRMSRRA